MASDVATQKDLKHPCLPCGVKTWDENMKEGMRLSFGLTRESCVNCPERKGVVNCLGVTRLTLDR